MASKLVAKNEFCIDDICITKDQFKELLTKNGIASSAAATPSPEPIAPVPELPVVEIASSEPILEPVSETTDTATSTPTLVQEIIPAAEPVAEPIIDTAISTTTAAATP